MTPQKIDTSLVIRADKETLKELDSFQESLKSRIDLRDRLKALHTIGAADVHYGSSSARACVCVVDYKTGKVLEKVIVENKIIFPYLSGYLLFREAPVILQAISQLKIMPDCFLFDGNGILHPRAMGLAVFLGIILKKPTVGCAKRPLLAGRKHLGNLGKERGSLFYIRDKGKILGAALRTKKGVREIYVSVGWGISLNKAIKIILDTSWHRIPQPLRLAHIYSRQLSAARG